MFKDTSLIKVIIHFGEMFDENNNKKKPSIFRAILFDGYFKISFPLSNMTIEYLLELIYSILSLIQLPFLFNLALGKEIQRQIFSDQKWSLSLRCCSHNNEND